MSPDAPTPEPYSFLEGLTAHSLSDWLSVGTHYINMSQATCTDDDLDATPPMLTIWFSQQSVKARGADRLAVLAWLAAQAASPPGA